MHGNQKKWAQRTWRLDAATDAMTALTIKGVARAILRLSWIRHGGDAVQCVFVMPRCNLGQAHFQGVAVVSPPIRGVGA